MAIDSVEVSSSIGIDGNSYTSSVSNDELTNEDFLTLMITELSLQDPTSPVDSASMLDTQMQMSTIETNQQTIAAMESLTNSFTQSALSSAANVIGQNIEDGNVSESGVNKAYTVSSVESVDGDIQVRAQEILYLENKIAFVDPDDSSNSGIIDYDVSGNILDSSGQTTNMKLALNSPGDPIIKDGNLVILDEDNAEVSDHNYVLSGTSGAVYSDEFTDIPFSQITKIF